MEAYEIPVKEERGDHGGLFALPSRLGLRLYWRVGAFVLCVLFFFHDNVASLAFCIAGGGIALLSLMFCTHVFLLVLSADTTRLRAMIQVSASAFFS